MASIQCLNPKAELARHAAALELNISGARGLQEIMRTNLGPKGTMKMFVLLLCASVFFSIRFLFLIHHANFEGICVLILLNPLVDILIYLLFILIYR